MGSFSLVVSGVFNTIANALLLLGDLLYKLVSFLLIPLIVISVGGILYSSFVLNHGGEVISGLEYVFRCEFYPDFITYFDYINLVRDFWDDTICWSNSLGLLNRLLSAKFLLQETKKCTFPDGKRGTFIEVMRSVGTSLKSFFSSTTLWIFSNPFTHHLPLFTVMETSLPLGTGVYQFLTCLCQVVEPLWKALTFPLTNPQKLLPCAVDNIGNGLLLFFQVVVSAVTNFFLTVLTLVVNLFTSGDLLGLLTYLFDNKNTQFYYDYKIPFNKLILGLEFGGEWSNDNLRNVICIIVSESIAGSVSDAAVLAEYNTCMARAREINLFCLFSRFGAFLVRLVEVLLVQPLFNVFRFINFADDFKWTLWNTDLVWDSLRTPLVGDVSSLFPSTSKNETLLILSPPNCSDIFPSIDNSTVYCAQCAFLPMNRSFEECLCGEFSQKLDNIIFDASGVRIVKPVLCDLVFGVVRLAVALGKWGVDFLKSLPFHSVEFLAEYKNIDRVLDELGGPPTSFNSGLLYAPNKIMEGLLPNHRDIHCLVSVFTYTGKALVEGLRLVLYILVNVFKDIRGEQALAPNLSLPGVSANYLCVYDPGNVNTTQCLNMENSLRWLRLPRNDSLLFKENVPLVVMNTTTTTSTLDCLCRIVNLDFDLSGFPNVPPEITAAFANFPRLCCLVNSIIRVVVELWKLFVNIVLSLVQTIVELSSSFNRIFVLTYLSCLIPSNSTSSSGVPCSNINSALTDLSEALQCPCITIRDIESIPGVSLSVQDLRPLDCLCGVFTGLNQILSNALIEVRQLAQLLLGTFQCVDIVTGKWKNTPQCTQVLPEKVGDFFKRITSLLDGVELTAVDLICTLGTVLYFDCVNINPVNCIELGFDLCVLEQCPQFQPVQPQVLNLPPSVAQVNDCVAQCGQSTCTACLTKAIIELQTFNATFLCPNPCQSIPCRPSDRLKAVVRSVFTFVIDLINIPLTLLSQLFIFAIDSATGGSGGASAPAFPFTIAEYVDLFLTSVGEGLFGVDLFKSWGLLQHLGDLLNCVAGPPQCIGASPTTDQYPSFTFILTYFINPITVPTPARCVGNLFVVLGNIVRDVFTGIKNVIVDVVGIVESLFSKSANSTSLDGNGTLSTWIRKFFIDLFDLIFVKLLGNLSVLFDAITATIASVFSILVGIFAPSARDSTYTAVYVVVKTVTLIGQVALDVISAVIKFFTGKLKKRSLEEDILNEVLLNISSSSIPPLSSLADLVAYAKSKLPPSMWEEEEGDKKKRYTGDDDYFQNKYNLSNIEMSIIRNPLYLLPLMKQDTFCYKAMSTLPPLNQLSLSEEIIFKMCYMLVLVPIINNKVAADNPEGEVQPIPLDLTYNMETLTTSWVNASNIVDSYAKWNTLTSHSVGVYQMGTMETLLSPPQQKREVGEGSVISTLSYKNFYDYLNRTQPEHISQHWMVNYLRKNDGAQASPVREAVRLVSYVEGLERYLESNPGHVSQYENSIRDKPYSVYSWFVDPQKVQDKLEANTPPTLRRSLKLSMHYLSHSYLERRHRRNVAAVEHEIYNYKKRARDVMRGMMEKRTPPDTQFPMYPAELFINNTLLPHNVRERINGVGAQAHTTANTVSHLLYEGGELLFKTLPLMWRQYTSTTPSSQKRVVQQQQTLRGVLFNMFINHTSKITSSISFISSRVMENTTQRLYNGAAGVVNVSMERTLANIISQGEGGEKKEQRPTLVERLYQLHQGFGSLKVMGVKMSRYLPELPPTVQNMMQQIGTARTLARTKKRGLLSNNNSTLTTDNLVNITLCPTCNCTIVQDFVQEVVDIATYCYEKQALGRQISLVTYTGPVVEVVRVVIPPNATSPKIWDFENWLTYQLSGVKVPETVLGFITEPNREVDKGPVGLPYLFSRLLPFGKPCKRVHLTCELGIGLERAVLISLLVFFLGFNLFFLILPGLGGVFNNLVLSVLFRGSAVLLLVTLTTSIAWGYDPYPCYSTPTTSLLSLIFNSVTLPPLFPECGPGEVTQFLETYIVTQRPLVSYSSLIGSWKALLRYPSVENYTSPSLLPLPCPERVVLESCTSQGFSLIPLLGVGLTKFFPSLSRGLRQSWLVRGGFLNFILFTSQEEHLTNDGLLGGLFTGYNATEVELGVNTTAEACFSDAGWPALIGVGALLILFVVFGFSILVRLIILLGNALSLLWTVVVSFLRVCCNEPGQDSYAKEMASRYT